MSGTGRDHDTGRKLADLQSQLELVGGELARVEAERDRHAIALRQIAVLARDALHPPRPPPPGGAP